MELHVVERGESLRRIAEEYIADVNQAFLLNRIENPKELVAGQTLGVPEVEEDYVVQPGDNLWLIASNLGVTVKDLVQTNDITNPSLIYVGEMLKIPFFIHTVKPGEYLWAIALRYDVTIYQILQTNQIESPSLIYPGQTLQIPRKRKPTIEVNAYTIRMNAQGRQEVLALGRNFTYLSPFVHSFHRDGSLTEVQGIPMLEAGNANQVSPLFVITNFREQTFDSDLAATLLRNTQLQETLLTNILKIMKEKNYAGLTIDFEYVYPEDRENYSIFLRRARERLHPDGFTLSTSLAPKEREDQKGLLYEAHDYPVHGEIVDFVILMTYEWGWAGGEPWPIAPINKMRDVLDYAITAIPSNKIMLGIPLYGRDWKIPWEEGTIAQMVSPMEAINTAAKINVAIQYHEVYQSPYYHYVDEGGQEHEVWFEDAKSMQAKYDLIKAYGLRGLVFGY
ncbi:spore germination protein [Oceanobacillus limi]|uniref:Spore germination protein n=1 Tax=Oceanobacillus limi TaxID=930131 RepID=A0A1I0B5N6_9BACI|nr:spore germination protein [Oceanobacillus limi]